jgi:PKD domain
MRLAGTALLLASTVLAACTIRLGSSSTQDDPTAKPTPGTSVDGSVCRTDNECVSGHCNLNLCGGASCACPSGGCGPAGSPSSACQPGWVCAHFESDDFLLGHSSHDNCAAPCPACPDHYVCYPDSTFCVEDSSWASPVVTATATPDHAAPGDTIVFHAGATSPIGDTDLTYTWKFNDQPQTSAMGPDAKHTYSKGGVYDVEIRVESGGGERFSEPTVTVTICGNKGDACGDGNFGLGPCCGSLQCTYGADPNPTCQ